MRTYSARTQSRDSSVELSLAKPTPRTHAGCERAARARSSLPNTTTTQPSAVCALSVSRSG